MEKDLREKIAQKVSELKEVGDCCGIEIGNGKGLFIQVEHEEAFDSEQKEYFVELNDVCDEDWEPCGKYNLRVGFGSQALLLDEIEEYLKQNL